MEADRLRQEESMAVAREESLPPCQGGSTELGEPKDGHHRTAQSPARQNRDMGERVEDILTGKRGSS